MKRDPRTLIHAWLPHLLLIGLLVLGIWLLARVLAPLLEPILLAAALAMLTTPFLYHPVQAVLDRLFPKMAPGTRRQIGGILATALLIALLLTPALIVLTNTVGSLRDTIDLVVGLATKDQTQQVVLEQKIAQKIADIDQLYPNINLQRFELAPKLRSLVAEAMDFGSAFLNFMFAGTGVLAHLVLALISLAFFYAEGPRLAFALLSFSPLDTSQRERLFRRYRAIMLRLLNDTVATALIKGLILASLIWVIDHGFGHGVLPFVPIVCIGALITLLPLVGVTMVWLPLAGFEWSLGYQAAAVAMGLSCTAAHFWVDHLLDRLGRHIDERETWMSFLLFLGLIGGLLSFGIKGLVIGPMAVVFVATITSFWGPLYGLGPPEDPLTGEPANHPANPETPSSESGAHLITPGEES